MLMIARHGRRRDYQMVFGGGYRPRLSQATEEPVRESQGRERRVTASPMSMHQLLIIMGLAFLLFFCGRVMWVLFWSSPESAAVPTAEALIPAANEWNAQASVSTQPGQWLARPSPPPLNVGFHPVVRNLSPSPPTTQSKEEESYEHGSPIDTGRNSGN
jgi:hypothetical protein